MADKIYYKKGFKYQLWETYSYKSTLTPQKEIKTRYIDFLVDGTLIIKEGYAWDGPSGPTVDTKTFMRGSLVHDAFYQLIREGHLKKTPWREHADKVLREICLEDGMTRFRAWYVYRAVRRAAFSAAWQSNVKKIIVAPKPT